MTSGATMMKIAVMRKGSSSWGAISAASLLLLLLALSSSSAGASNDLGRLRTVAGHAGILRLRGGVSKYYNHTAPPRRAGIFEENAGGLPPGEGQSEWNKGGYAYEERDYTQWTKGRIQAMVHHLPPDGGVSFEDVKTVVGHSVVTYRSGKKWASVNWESFSVDFRLPASGANGTLHVREFFSDFPEDVEFGVTIVDVGDGSDGDKGAIEVKVMRYREEIVGMLGGLVEGMMEATSSQAKGGGSGGKEGGGQTPLGNQQLGGGGGEKGGGGSPYGEAATGLE